MTSGERLESLLSSSLTWTTSDKAASASLPILRGFGWELPKRDCILLRDEDDYTLML
jgi:hypothetical protein